MLLPKILLSFALAIGAAHAGAFPSDLSYSGRMTQPDGSPVSGPVDLSLGFYHQESEGTAVGPGLMSFSNTALTDGVFHLQIGLTPSQFEEVFPTSAAGVWIEIKDLTSDVTYPRQKFSVAPYAFKVPVDGSTLTYGADGNMMVSQVPTASLQGNIGVEQLPSHIAYLDGGSRVPVANLPSNTTYLGSTIDTSEIEDGTITFADLADNSCAANQVVKFKTGPNRFECAADESGDNSDAANLTSGTLPADRIAAGSLNDSKISALDANKLTGTVNNLRLDADLQDLADGSLSGGKVGAGISAANVDTGTLPVAVLPTSVARHDAAANFTAGLQAGGNDVLDSSDTGVAANKVLQLDGNGDLPILAGSALGLANVTATGVKLKDGDTNTVTLSAPATMTANSAYTLPASPDAGKFLTTDANGVMSWGNTPAAPYLTEGDLTAVLDDNYQAADADLTDLADGTLTGSKVGTGIDAANITTGTLPDARLDADLQDLADGSLTGSKVGTGIDAANITTGEIPTARIDTGNAANDVLQLDGSARIPAVDGSLVTALNASALASGTVAEARIGTFSAIDVDGGAIDGTPIGANAASTGAFTDVTMTGNLGVGTASPATPLHVQSTTTAPASFVSTNGAGTYTKIENTTATGYARQYYMQDSNWVGSIGSDTSGRMGISGGNTAANHVTIDTIGRVGFGVDAPGVKLDIDASATTFLRAAYPAGQTLQLGAGGGGTTIVQKGNGWLGLFTNSDGDLANPTNERMRIANDGKVGIGTASPANLLDVKGTIRATDGSHNNLYLNTATGQLDIRNGSPSGTKIRMGYQGGGLYAHHIDTGHSYTNNDGSYLRLSAYNKDTSTTEAVLTANGHGRVGIGTTTPGHALHVAGAIAGGAASNPWTATSNGSDIFLNTGVANSNIYLRPDGDGSTNGEINATRDYARVRSDGGDEYIRLDHVNERVGIGTTAPAAKLHVAGSILADDGMLLDTATSATLTDAGWYRFAESGTSPHNHGTFRITWTVPGSHGVLEFFAGAHFSDRDDHTLKLHHHSYYGTDGTISSVRMWSDANDTNDKYLEFYYDGDPDAAFTVSLIDGANWDVITPVAGADPGGTYLSDVLTTDRNFSLRSGQDGSDVVIDNAGNVGIGTASPASKLQVDGVTNIRGVGTTANLNVTSTTSWSQFLLNSESGSGDHRALFSLDTGGDFRIRMGDGVAGIDDDTNDARLFISSAGNVGIGTTSPAHNLSVDANTEWPIHIHSDLATAAHRPGFLVQRSKAGAGGVGDGDYIGSLSMGAEDSAGGYSHGWNGGAEIIGVAMETWSASARGTDLWFSTTAAGTTSAVTRMTIEDGGNVGIGTTAPAYELDISGQNARLQGASVRLRLDGTETNGRNMIIASDVDDPAGDFHIYDGTAGRAIIGYFYSPNALSLMSGGGSVGIGTTSPAQILHINDALRLEPISAPAQTAGNGDLYYDDSHALCVYLNGSWSKIVGSGTCG